MTMLYVEDSITGEKLPASWYLPQQYLDAVSSDRAQFELQQITKMEAQLVSYETEGISFPELGTVETIEDGFDYIGYQQKLRDGGRAEFISRNATSFPRLSSGQKPFIQAVVPIGVGLNINYFERIKAQRLGMPLESDKLMDCREEIDRKLDQAWHFGGINPDGLEVKGMFEWFNGGQAGQLADGTSIAKVPLTTGVSGNTWALKTGEEVFADIAAGINAVLLQSEGARRVNKIAMGLIAWTELTKKLIHVERGGIMKLEGYLREAFPGITWVIDTHFDAISLTNPYETFNGQGAVLFYADAANNFSFSAKRFDILRPYEHQGFTTTINTFGLTGGIKMKKPFSLAYMKGVTG